MIKISFHDLSESATLNEFHSVCGNLLGLPINFWDPENLGEKLYEDKREYYRPFCFMVENSTLGRLKCRQCDLAAVQYAIQTAQCHVYKCFADLTEIVMPIVIEGQVTAVMMAGQIMEKLPDAECIAMIEKLAHQLGLDCRRLREAYEHNLLVPPQKLPEVVKFLSIFCQYISVLGQDNLLLQRREESDAVGRTKQVIRQIYKEDDFSLEKLAGRVFISKSHLSRLFHAQTGETVISYLNRVRIREAERLLAKTKMTVSEICFDTGYKSLSYFIKTFKSIARKTPRQFRKELS